MSIRRRLSEFLHGLWRPRGADKVLLILHGLATIDDQLDERELGFIRAFAKRWGFRLGDALNDPGLSHPVEAPSFSSLRTAMADYLATKPPVDQAHQLRDVLTALVTIDGRICEHEELMLEELGRMIDEYVGLADRAGYAVFIAPRDDVQATAKIESLPAVHREQRPGGEVFRVGAYHSKAYAELVCGWYRDAGYAPIIERDPGTPP